MTVFYDHQIYSIQNYGGISRYFANLEQELKKIKVKVSSPILISQNYYKSAYIKLPTNNNIPFSFSTQYYPNQALSTLNLLKSNFDVFHPTYYDSYFLPYIKHKPFVITIFDMVHELFPENFEINDPTSKRKRILAQKADRIIAISQSTKKDIVDILHVPENKIDVVYLAAESKLKAKVLPVIERFILFVGKREGYKNFNFFLQSIYPVLKKYKIKLFCAGGGKFTSSEINLISSLGLLKMVTQKNVSSQELVHLYSSADLLVYPSLYEGFGLPLLEAFSFECPVVSSMTSSLPEVGGDAALYCNPRSKTDITEKIEQLLLDKNLRVKLINRGKKRKELFSWNKMAEQTLEVYKKVLL